VPTPVRLAERTTLRVGGPADRWVIAETDDVLISTVRECDADGVPVLILGGGSNLLVADAGFPGTVVQVATRGVEEFVGPSGAVIVASAGEPWDLLVDQTVGAGWSGVEALAGIPGLVGATPVQNVGAYGQEVSQVISHVRALDRTTGSVVDLDHDACGFGYRTSTFKRDQQRWVVLAATLRLDRQPTGEVRYSELARWLGVEVGHHVEVARIREAVLALRRSKAMVLDDDDPDTNSAGSFFVNPIVAGAVAGAIDPSCPRYPAAEGIKLSAAWLIEHAGVTRGWRVRPDSGARVSTKHTLALVNAGGATSDDVIELARAIRARVDSAFGITLQPEPRLVNCTL
jgi:UDP-N-acetylmuramate dehydrogenase